MSNEIVINVAPEETRVALLKNGVLVELYYDRKRERGLVGNVYKGVVERVLPGMQAAFIDIAAPKEAFLYVADVVPNGRIASASAPAETDEIETVEFEEGLEPVVEEGGETTDVALPETLAEEEPILNRPRKRGHYSIEELLSEGQDLLVQVSKDPIGTKGPRVTGFISLPGRYLVSIPLVNRLGISRRIESERERHRLRDLIVRLRQHGGYIVRTVSEGITEKEIQNDITFLDLLWKNILKKQETLKAPALLHTDLDLVFRTVRDLFTEKIDKLVTDSRSTCEQIREFVGTTFGTLASRVEEWEKEEPLFEAYGLEAEITRARNRRVWLKSGGYLVIDHTEALTVIDVNTGRFVGKRNLAETVLKTNLEAAEAIARQLRLRNIGGIIIVDFIDMDDSKSKDRVFRALEQALSTDKAKTRLLKISALGLVEMSRQRTQEGLLKVLCEPCPSCEGLGYTKAPTTVCYEIFREIRRTWPSIKDKKMVLVAHPSVVALLQDQERSTVEALEKSGHKKLVIKADIHLPMGQYELYGLGSS